MPYVVGGFLVAVGIVAGVKYLQSHRSTPQSPEPPPQAVEQLPDAGAPDGGVQ